MKLEKQEAIIEGILFAMGESVEISKLAEVLETSQEEVQDILHKMMKRYQKEDRGIEIIEIEHAVQMCTKKEMYEYLIKIAKQPKQHVLTDVLLETLSIIAYKQPITRLEIIMGIYTKVRTAVWPLNREFTKSAARSPRIFSRNMEPKPYSRVFKNETLRFLSENMSP